MLVSLIFRSRILIKKISYTYRFYVSLKHGDSGISKINRERKLR